MKRDLQPHELIERSIIKKFRKTIWNPFTLAVRQYQLIQPGDKIAVCISGGKDSMLMAKLMQLLQRYSEVPFEVVFLGCNKIALGHHFNDVIETTVMSMFYGSQMQAMLPKLHSTNFAGMELIRPLYCIHEEDILAWKQYNDLEFIQCACRFTENCTMCDNGGGGSKRQEVKILLRRLRRDNPNIERSIFNSIHAVNLDMMPGYKSGGVLHSFLDDYDERGKKSE